MLTFDVLQIDADGSGYISVSELGNALELCGFKLPGYEIRDIVSKFDTGKVRDGKLDYDEFKKEMINVHSSSY